MLLCNLIYNIKTNCCNNVSFITPLKYNENATKSANKHSKDMKENSYFDHKNLKNETPFDRMKKEERGLFLW